MTLRIDKLHPLGVGEQLMGQLRLLIASGALEPKSALPTVKDLAEELGVNVNTVAAAYKALEREGYLTQRKKAGTRVAEKPPLDTAAALMSSLAAGLAAQAERLGLDGSELTRVVAAQLSLQVASPRYRAAVLARDPLRAAVVADGASAVLGERFLCVPQTLDAYDSRHYHLTLVDPELTSALTPKAVSSPLPYHLQYSPHFPAAAD